eukprot:gene21971-29030_t
MYLPEEEKHLGPHAAKWAAASLHIVRGYIRQRGPESFLEAVVRLHAVFHDSSSITADGRVSAGCPVRFPREKGGDDSHVLCLCYIEARCLCCQPVDGYMLRKPPPGHVCFRALPAYALGTSVHAVVLIEAEVTLFVNMAGACERIYKTAIPAPYTSAIEGNMKELLEEFSNGPDPLNVSFYVVYKGGRKGF